jgi:hypothetical protein
MILCRFLTAAIFLAFCFFINEDALAEGGTEIVATKDQPTHVSETWPAGVGDLVNAPSRSSGWNSWFSEWPNDVNHYAFEIESTEDINGLLEKLAAIKSDLRQIRLSYMKEPKGLGWVTQIPEGNGIAVIFSIGDQARIDEWFKQVRKPFGQMEFIGTPVAVPPTLTIFVQNETVELDKLKIPEGIDILAGPVPAVFHKSNTTIEKQREQEAAKRDPKRELELTKKKLDEKTLATMTEIESFLDSRKGTNKP